MAVVKTTQKNKNALRDIADSYKKDYVIRVGFPASKVGGTRYPSVRPEYGVGGDPPTVVEVAAKNEFGSGVPRRSFMKLSTPGAKKVMSEKLRQWAPKINRGETTKLKIVEVLAPFVTDVFKSTITNLNSPPNSEATIAIKGSSNPLIDTRLMVQTLTYEVKEDKGQK